MTQFKVGDKVRFNDGHRAQYIHDWRRENGYPVTHGGNEFTVIKTFANGNIKIAGSGLNGGTETWEGAAFTGLNRVPTLADDLRLHPQDRTILAHLKAGKPITPMKAFVVYGLTRLAAHIHRIKQVGYSVEKTMERDESGHRYAEYKLIGARCDA